MWGWVRMIAFDVDQHRTCGDGRPRKPALSKVEGSGRVKLGEFPKLLSEVAIAGSTLAPQIPL
ncbi:MAG: hypothetical protein DMG93_09295 [Acidobacteria bacterium]|nr:MAG: hypothetical protein DMG93_09295 [Acidobacteriota bacterium]